MPKKRSNRRGKVRQPGRGKGKVGRPVEVTDAMLDRIVGRIEKGSYLDSAAEIELVSPSTVKKLVRAGVRELRRLEAGEHGPAPVNADRAMRFALAFQAARAKAEEDDLTAIRKSTKWQARAWRLEHRNPGRYGRAARLAAEASMTVPAAGGAPSSAGADAGEATFSLRFSVTDGPETSGESDAGGA